MRNNYILGLVLGFAVLPAVSLAQTENIVKPKIETYNTATSSTTIITAPSGYQSSVVSTYDSSGFHTVATSTPLTAQDIKKMQDNMRSQQDAMMKMFQAQQTFFDEQNKMFESMMNSAFPELVSAPAVSKKTPTTTTKKDAQAVVLPRAVATTSVPTVASTSLPELVAPPKLSLFQRFLHFFGF